MKKIIQILIIGLLMSNVCWGQTWYFGSKAGIEFNNSGSSWTVSALSNSQMYTLEGCAVANDANGNIRLYSNGQTVWSVDASGVHHVVTNGTGLTGNNGSTQSGVFVRFPGSRCGMKYYFFTTGESLSTTPIQDWLSYSIIDFTNNTNGEILSNEKNISLISSGVGEKISAINDGTGNYWFLCHGYGYGGDGNKFFVYKISSAGIQRQPDISLGSIHPDLRSTLGQMKFSRSGSKLALAMYNTGRVDLFDFNRITGSISFDKTITLCTSCGLYGLEFSPNEQQLYVTSSAGTNMLYQIQVTNGTFTQIYNPNSTGYNLGSLQLGPDNKIYCANFTTNEGFISTIEKPNELGVLCNYTLQTIPLSPNTKSTFGLPTVIQNENRCGVIVQPDPCSKCHNVKLNYNGVRTVRNDTVVLNCNTRNLSLTTNNGCNAPNIVQVLGCTVTDINGATLSWASAFTNAKGIGSLNIPNATSPPVTYYVDYYFGTTNSPGVPGPRFDTCDHIRLTIIDSCLDIPCICPPKPIITLKQQFRPGTVKQLNCGASEEIECNKLYTLDVDPACQPAGCSDKRYEISVRANGGPTQTFINQAVNIQPLATDKEFTITIKTYCGGKLCTTCTITLTVKCKCPPPPCCKTPVGTEFNAAVSTVREVSGTSFANLSFALNGNGKQYTQVRASVISFGIHADDKKCLDCYNNSRQWASISGGNLTGVQGFSRVFSGDNNGVNTNTREVTYTSSTPQIINTAQLTLNLMLPPMQTLSCCNVYATAYIKFTYRDNQCNECEKIIGIKIPLNGQQGKQPELINTPANIRAAGPAK